MFFCLIIFASFLEEVVTSNSFTVIEGNCNGDYSVTLSPSTQVISDEYTCRRDGCDSLSGYKNTFHGVVCPSTVTRCWEQDKMYFTSTGSCATCTYVLSTTCSNSSSSSVSISVVSDKIVGLKPSLISMTKVQLQLELSIYVKLILPCNCRLCTNIIQTTFPLIISLPIPETNPLSVFADILKLIPIPLVKAVGYVITLGQWSYLVYKYYRPVTFGYKAINSINSCYKNLLKTFESMTCHFVDLPDPTPCIQTVIMALESKKRSEIKIDSNVTLILPEILYLSTGDCPQDNHTIAMNHRGPEFIGFQLLNATNIPVWSNSSLPFCFRDISDLSNDSLTFAEYEKFISDTPNNSSSFVVDFVLLIGIGFLHFLE